MRSVNVVDRDRIGAALLQPRRDSNSHSSPYEEGAHPLGDGAAPVFSIHPKTTSGPNSEKRKAS